MHPLVRAFFRSEFALKHAGFKKRVHHELYCFYRDLPEKELPDTLEEMQPLFHAVAHGCAAGLHQLVLDEVYWPRISREKEYYSTAKLGAFSDDLAVVAHFFSEPWSIPAAGLTEYDQVSVLNWAGFRLRALGRLGETVEPFDACLEMLVKQEDWKQAAAQSSNLSELQLALGWVSAAVNSGERSVAYADQSGDMFHRMGLRTGLAEVLHQAGQPEDALELFVTAEQLQREYQPEYRRLYSLQGFRYCDLLLAQGRVEEVLGRAEEMLDGSEQDGLLSIALYQLSLGRAHHAQGDLPQAREKLDQAVVGLRKYGSNQHLPRGLLSRAALWRDLGRYELAQRDLDEVREIAEAGEMKLHLTDYHLEMARLLLAQSPHPSPGGRGALTGDIANTEANDKNHAFPEQETINNGTPNHPSPSGRGAGGEGNVHQHVKAAADLIQKTGYHRRDKELQALQHQLKRL